ncbi:MAG: hypothetical protein HRT57_17595 [Crocinitomicaceae bacterium]|nr:hypothetical protein [Crocinitomicaceae bacterium]
MTQTNCCSENPINLDLEKEFNSKRIFADWYEGEIRSQLGSRLYYLHAGYGSVYEKE